MLLVLTGIIGVTNLDLIVSSYCFVEGQGFVNGKELPWHFLYRFGEWPPLLMALIALFILLAGLVIRGVRKYRLACGFLVLLYLLGPGVLVNLFFKECWGRPRPVEIVEFGGTQQFVHPWQANSAVEGKSFPSGHASVAFYMAAPFFLLRHGSLLAHVTGCSWVPLGFYKGGIS
jgi:membrane-associated PAP2 superfamily phosphatase